MVKKQDKIYDEIEVNFTLEGRTPKELKDKTVFEFLKEKSGYWKEGVKHVTRYKYYVETLQDKRRIYLLRPTFLNKGIDFQVWVEKMDDQNDKRPSHNDIFHDLKIKQKENLGEFRLLMEAVEEVWSCNEPDDVLKNKQFSFTKGFSPEQLLKILKWLFIEQDITYWNYDGRMMLRMAIGIHTNID